jgi:hypothetical protein
MVETTFFSPKRKNSLLRNALKATVKTILVCIAYLVLSQFTAPLSQFVPSLHQTIQMFVTVYIVLMIVANLTSGSIIEHVFNVTKAFFIVAYIASSLGAGLLTVNMEGLNVLVDFHVLLLIAMTLGLMGFAKSVLQTINYVNEKAELSLPA